MTRRRADEDGTGPAAAVAAGRGGRGRGRRGAGPRPTARPTARPTPNERRRRRGGDRAAERRAPATTGRGRRRGRRRAPAVAAAAAARARRRDDGAPTTPATVVHVREPRNRAGRGGAATRSPASRGSTRLEAKKQRRREGRDAGRRRPPILTEAEFLARREAVDRVMVVRQRGDLTQIGVLEDDVLVEHYVARPPSSTMVGNVYLGRVQNVLPSMEAAFVDIGRGRNAVLYAGEVNWDAAGLDGQPRAHRARAQVRRHRPRPGDQGPDRPQGRPADQPDQPAPAGSWCTCRTAR